MLKCLKYEAYKLLLYKTYLIIIFVCIIISVLLSNYQAETQLDNGLLNNCVTQDEYDSFLENIKASASEQGSVSIFKNDQQTFSSRNIKKTAKDMAKMEDIIISGSNDMGVNIIARFDYIHIVILFVIIISVYIIFFKEKEDNLYFLIKTTPKGNSHTYIAKTCMLFAVSFITQLICFLSAFFVIIKYNGFGNLERSIQSVPLFMSCDMRLSVLELLVLIFVLRVVGTFIFSLVVSLIALIIKNPILFIFITLFALAINVLLTLIPYQSPISFLKYINLIYIFDPVELISSYRNLNILGYPVNIKLIIMIVMPAILFLSTIIGLERFKKKELVSKKISIKKPIKHFSIMDNCKSIYFFELYKIGFVNKATIILLAFMLFHSVNIINTEYYKSPDNYYYANYIDILGGELNETKIAYIEKEKEKIEESESAVATLNEQYNKGEISLAQLQKELNKKQFTVNRQLAFRQVLNQYEYILENPKAQFIYEAGYEKLFNIGDDNKYYGLVDFLTLLVLIVLCSAGVSPVEYKSGMLRILNTTPNGTIVTMLNKMLASITFSTMLFVISCLGKVLIIYKNYGYKNILSPLCSIQEFSAIQNISLLGGLIIKFTCMYIFCISITVLTTVVSSKLLKKL